MNVVIIEDEHLTAERIRNLLQGIDPAVKVLAMLDSVRSAVNWFGENEAPDLVFMDIQLGDGLSFEIFEAVPVESPVIFLTAYQEYAIRAFKVNSVDYLLKPVKEEELRTALEKYTHFFTRESPRPVLERQLLDSIRKMIARPYKSRFMIRVGERIRSVDVDHVSYFYSLRKGTYLHTEENRNYVIDYTLDALGEQLDPETFHRINRRYIIRHTAIRELINLSATRLKVILHQCDDPDIFVSRERLPAFKEWLDQ